MTISTSNIPKIIHQFWHDWTCPYPPLEESTNPIPENG